jgi:hypothetical protein
MQTVKLSGFSVDSMQSWEAERLPYGQHANLEAKRVLSGQHANWEAERVHCGQHANLEAKRVPRKQHAKLQNKADSPWTACKTGLTVTGYTSL